MKHISKRVFEILFFEGGQSIHLEVELNELFSDTSNEDNFEYVYAMQDSIDDILDLRVNDTMYFQFNRDDVNTKGVIRRIK